MNRESARADWDIAYRWLCQRRQHAPANADVWDVRFHWPKRHNAWLKRVLAGQYRLSPMQVFGRRGQRRAQWSAQDALVLKWVALQVEHRLPHPESCHHLRGNGGVSGSTRQVAHAWLNGQWEYVYRTDIRGYYRHILKYQVENQLQGYITDPVCLELCKQWLYYSVEEGGEIYTPTTGICRGSALSPLVGGSLLRHIDSCFSGRDTLFYARYMDDFIIFTKTRWHLRKAIKTLHDFFDLGGFETHPDKTQVGRMEHGFDWLGIWYSRDGPRIAPRAMQNYRERIARLYEQAKHRRLSLTETEGLVREYEARWMNWASRHLGSCVE